MSDRIDRLCDELRIRLNGMDRRLEALRANGMATSEKSRHAIESRIDRIEQTIFDRRACVRAANTTAKAWLESKKARPTPEAGDWSARYPAHALDSHADGAEAYALAVFELAAAAADEAAHAALEALLARHDADRARRTADSVS